jgi:hypothetical protein
MRTRLPRHTTVRAAAVLAACAVAAPAAVAAMSPGDTQPATGVPGRTLPPVAGFDADVTARFSVLRVPRRADDRLTVGTLGADRSRRGADVDLGYARSTGMNVDAARRVADSPETYVVPGQGVVCIVRSAGGGTCTPNEHVHEDFQVQACGQLPRGVISLTGLVADDVSAVVVRQRDRSLVPASVSRNFVDARLAVHGEPDLPVAVELASSRGTVTVPVAQLALADLSCSR